MSSLHLLLRLLTGEQMLERAGLLAGERVLVTGASGGVGSGIVQLARARGAIPYAVVGPGKEGKRCSTSAPRRWSPRGRGDLRAR